jgi:uncharacterized integral membrane protein (TIGR00697 family)
MINELLFLGNILFVVGLDFIALRLGREFLLASIIVQGLLANIFVLKQVCMFGLVVTCTDAFIIGMVLALNLTEEVFGKESSNAAINSYFFSLVALFGLKLIHLAYLPAPLDDMQTHYSSILKDTGRIVVATLVVSFASLHLDRYLYRLLSKRLNISFLFLKNFITTAISQLFDTIAFSYLGLYGLFPSMWDLIVFSYVIKLLSLCFITLILFLFKGVIKKIKLQVLPQALL